ncbi:MAG: hypothetical protein NWR72_16790 [Bacteroidia bacterium]|nr:hypothetical protein [Bacteroidia bacterium]
MMTLQQLKAHVLDHSAQVIVFQKDGLMVDSCHTLSGVKSWENKSLYDSISLLRSMQFAFSHIGNEEVIDIPCVDFVLEQRQGYYDFTFSLHPENPDLVVWLVKDQTRVYRYYAAIQQERNLLRLEKEYKERGQSA